MNRALVSKILAVAWLAVPLAALAVADDPQHLAQLHAMSREQLITLATGFYDDTFSGTLLGAALGGLAYLGAVEALALLIRWVWGMLLGPERARPSGAQGNSAPADA